MLDLLGDGPRFLSSVPCGDTDLIGSAVHDSALLLAVLIRGTERKKSAVFPRGRCALTDLTFKK